MNENYAINDYVVKIDLTNDEFFNNSEIKSFEGKNIDFIKSLNHDDFNLKITKRFLQNGDSIIFFEGSNCKNEILELKIGAINKTYNYDNLYKKPEYDKRYGENKVTGNSFYFDLDNGSAIASKIYYYKEIYHYYENEENDVSHILDFYKESNDIDLKDDKIILRTERYEFDFCFSIMLSKEKLFSTKDALEEFEKFHFESVYNNCVWCTFFIRPSGSYTKLPYSIEPFTRNGYGYNLHHSSRKDLLPLYKQTDERFYRNMLENAIYQAYMYQNYKYGIFLSDYTSKWLKDKTGFNSPYIDTRLNETFILSYLEFERLSGLKFIDNPLNAFAEFLYNYSKNGNLYRTEEGVFFPDYFKENSKNISHASLNHQLSLANLMYKAYKISGEIKYLELFEKIIKFVEETRDCWINKDNGDLYYGLEQNNEGKYVYFGADYTYVTLIDLLNCQKDFLKSKGVLNSALRILTIVKITCLMKTDYDISFETDSLPASGELIDSKDKVLNLIREIYKDDKTINILIENNLVTDDEIEFVLKTKSAQCGFLNNQLKEINEKINEFEEIDKSLSSVNKITQIKNYKDEIENKLETVNQMYEKERKTNSDLNSLYEQEQKKLNEMTLNYDNELKRANAEEKRANTEEQRANAEEQRANTEEQRANAEEQRANTEEQRAEYFKERLQKKASNYEYERKRALELRQKCNEYENKMRLYQTSKIFRFMIFKWKVTAKVKRYIKNLAYKTGHYIYIKTVNYPKIRKIFVKINSNLKIFKNTNDVITYGSNKKASVNLLSNYTDKKIKPISQMSVAMIVDEFTYNSFKYECNAIPIEPSNWKEKFENNDIDLFFCESAWSGNDETRRPWKGQIYCSTNFKNENRGVLFEILEHCKQNNIPTVFWNKEDPTHYPDKIHNFVDTAVKFDHVFTTAKECVEKYKNDYGHKSVHLLMFATQPRLFNPIEKFERTNEIIFAGSWYNQHPARCKEMGAILDKIIESPYPLKIYDRHSNTNDPNHYFPDRFKQYLNPALSHDKMEIAYKSSKYALNINTVTDSDTMFARRVFELMSSNTLVISNYSKGMEELFGESVIFIDGKHDIQINNDEEKRLNSLYNVLKHHTYKQRFKQILTDSGINFKEEKDDITIIFKVKTIEDAQKAYEKFEKISIEHKKAILLIDKYCDEVTLRKITVKYNSGNISTISECYCLKYEDILKIQTNYFVFADNNINNELLEKSIYHFEYIDKNIGITGVSNTFKLKKSKDINNVIFYKTMFEKVKNNNFNSSEGFTVYEI